MLNNIDNIYVCHYTKLRKRKSHLESLFEDLKIVNTQWVEVYDKESLTNDMLKGFVNIRKPLGLGSRTNSMFHERRTLRLSEISLLLKHHFCWRDVVEKGYDNVLVLEDDVTFIDNFVEKYNTQTNNLPDDYDLIWVGGYLNWKGSGEVTNKYFYPGPRARCTHAYIISNKCCNVMIKHFIKNNYPADFMFDDAIHNLNLKSFWMEPSLIHQNHKMWSTSIQNDNRFITG